MKKNAWETYAEKDLKKLEKVCAEYRAFLDNGKTERECVDTIVNTIEAEGYQELEAVIKKWGKLKAGDKVYSVWMNKSVVMFQIGKKPMAEGINILGAHIDSPRLDVREKALDRFPNRSRYGFDRIPNCRHSRRYRVPNRAEGCLNSGQRCREEGWYDHRIERWGRGG